MPEEGKGDRVEDLAAASAVRATEGSGLCTDFSLIEDEAALAALWSHGRQAWSDVGSATEWVERTRGNRE